MNDKCDNSKNQNSVDKYKFEVALQQRNFEIQMFWQRCNYFLLLNSAVGAGAISSAAALKNNLAVASFCLIGAFVCFAWVKISLGSKYWQSYWEQVVAELQKGVGFTTCCNEDCKYHNKEEIQCNAHNFFSKGDKTPIERRVRTFLGMDKEGDDSVHFSLCEELHTIWSLLPLLSYSEKNYDEQVLDKPSVSKWMHYTALFFLVVWLIAAAIALCLWSIIAFFVILVLSIICLWLKNKI